jgi:hypothetical protein
MPEDLGDDLLQLWVSAHEEVKEKATDAALAGPKKVTEAALEIERLSSELVGAFAMFQRVTSGTESTSDRIKQHVKSRLLGLAQLYRKSVSEFVLAAQAALDDDGSRKSK